MIRNALVYKAANPWTLKRKIQFCQSSGYTRKLRQWDLFCWTDFINALFLTWGSSLPVRDWLLKFMWCWTMSWPPKTLRVLHWMFQSVCVCFSPNIMSVIEHLDQGVIRTFKAPCVWQSMSTVVSGMEEHLNRETSLNSRRIILLKILLL